MNRKYTPPVIGLDLDGVIIDHSFNRQRLARGFGYTLSFQEASSNIIQSKLPTEIYRKIQQIIYYDPVIGLNPPVFKGVKEGLSFLRQINLPYFLISRRQKTELAIALLQKRKLWPDYLDKSNVFFVQDERAKNEKAKELGVSVYLDDDAAVLEALVDVPHRFLFDHYGVHNNSGDSYQKVSSWSDFIEKVKKI